MMIYTTRWISAWVLPSVAPRPSPTPQKRHATRAAVIPRRKKRVQKEKNEAVGRRSAITARFGLSVDVERTFSKEKKNDGDGPGDARETTRERERPRAYRARAVDRKGERDIIGCTVANERCA